MKNIIIYFSFYLFTFSATINAQVGVGIEQPKGIFHVDPLRNTTDVASSTTDDFLVQDVTGNVAIGNNSPKVKLDVRGAAENAIGLGNTNQTAVQAEEGAIRYNTTLQKIQYSNGIEWNDVIVNPLVKSVFIATKNSQEVVCYAQGGESPGTYSGMPHRTPCYLTSWTQKYNNSGDGGTFNTTTGEFTAKRDGVFTATFTFALESGRIRAWNGSSNAVDNNQIEAIWRLKDTNGVEINAVKCANSFPSDSRNNVNDAGSAPAASSCTASFYMQNGQKIRPEAWIDLDPGNRKLFNSTSTGSGATLTSYYNNLTIVEN